MRFKYKNIKINIQITVIIVLILFAFNDVRNYFSNYTLCFLFVLFHEAAHVFLAVILGESLVGLNITICGVNAVITDTNCKSSLKALIYLAGPFANIVLSAIFYNFKIVFEVNMALAIVNLIPIYPLDGYKILGIILSKSKCKQKTLDFNNKFMVLVLFFVGIYVFVLYGNPSIIMLSIYTTLIQILEKCKI